MCLIGFAWQASAEYSFALVANRDEFHERPTEALHWWDNNIAAGRDLQAGGSWIGVNRRGRMAAITNFRDGADAKDYALSRGALVHHVLSSREPLAQLEAFLLEQSEQCGGFNLLFGDLVGDHQELRFISNRDPVRQVLRPGIYSFSNGAFSQPWPKTTETEAALRLALRKRDPQGFWDVLSSRTKADDELLPDTGVGLELERFLSSSFIVSENYGTRSSHRLLCKQQSSIAFTEQRYDVFGEITGATNLVFDAHHKIQ